MDNDANTDLIRAFNHLVDDCPIEQLKSSLESMFRAYLTSFEVGVIPNDCHIVVNNHYYLIDFFFFSSIPLPFYSVKMS